MSSSTISGYAIDHNASNKPDNGLRVEARGVYMLLWDQNEPNRFHWGILAAITDTFGILFHLTLDGTNWKYVVETKDVSKSRDLLVAIKLADMETDHDSWIAGAKKVARATTVPGELRCRTWVLEVVYDLAKAGFLRLSIDRDSLAKFERDATEDAEEYREVKKRAVIPNKAFPIA